jgi:GWxTD domain-containing protein
MKKIPGLLVLLAVLVPAVAGQTPAARPKDPQAKAITPKPALPKIVLPERYRRWLNEEVVYIITKRERDVFLQLQTDRERDIFIEAFWKQRDPTPGTPQNEAQEEHQRRLDYANKFYGRSVPQPGWKTDRGRIYILLGPPRNIEQYDNINGVYPTEIWFYLGDPALGLPTAFNVIFFRKEGVGDYILYSPTEHGPQSLIASSMSGYRDVTRISGSMSNEQAAYKELQQLEPNLARQTLSLIPGEATQPGYESLASTRLMATIAQVPQKKVQADYADAILKYKDFIEVDYTANYMASDVLVEVIRDPGGASFVNYTIEPARISAEEIGGKYEVRFLLNGRVSDASGRTVYQFDKDFPLSLSAAELEDIRAQSLSIQDAFPVIPGTYTFDLLLKNSLSKEFAAAAATLVVPGPSGPPGLGPLLLGYGAERAKSDPRERVPFKVGETQILCQTRKTFGAGETLVLFYQPLGITPELRSTGTLLTTFTREDKEFSRRTRALAEAPSEGVIDTQSLRDFTPGYYQVRVALLDGAGKELAQAKENFEISLSATIPRPRVMSKVVPAAGRGEEVFTTGVQLLNRGDLQGARAKLEEARNLAPQRVDYAVAYAQALMRLKEYVRVKDALLPFAEAEDAPAEVPALLGLACQALDEFEPAVGYYTTYLTRFGANIEILNFLGTCYFRLGNRDEALKAWTKSLEVSPDQPKIKDLVDSLKKK